MAPKSRQPNPLRELDIFDPDTAKMVRSRLEASRTAVSLQALSLLAEETIWGLSVETSFGRTVAEGVIALAARAPGCLHSYRTAVRAAGAKGPTVGRLMARHLVPVLISGRARLRHLFSKAFEIMERAGAYTLTKPMAALDRMLESGDHRSSEAYLRLLCSSFSRKMTYNRRQQLSALLPKTALRFGPAKRPWLLMQLDRLMRMDDRLAAALMTGLEQGAELLSARSLRRFVSEGLQRCRPDPRQAEKFFALESSAGRSALDALQVATAFSQVRPQLNRYLRARIGREVTARPLSMLPSSGRGGLCGSGGTCSDRQSIYLPTEVDRFETKDENIRLYKCLTRFEAGLVEFSTFDFDLERALEQCGGNPQCWCLSSAAGQPAIDPSDEISDLEQFFGLFPEPLLAEDLFLIFEHGRIRHLIAESYPGMIATCLPMFQQEARRLLSKGNNRHILLPAYAAVACGLPVEEMQAGRGAGLGIARRAVKIFESAIQQSAPTPETSGEMTAVSYAALQDLQESRQGAAGRYRSLQTPFLRRIRPDLHYRSGLPFEQSARSLKKQLASAGFHIYTSVLRKHLNDCRGEVRIRDIEEILRNSENHTLTGRAHRRRLAANRLDFASHPFSLFREPDPPSTANGGPAFWYREWDCRLGDYLSRHARVQECTVEGECCDYYDSTLERYDGLVQLIRSAFELLKPQALKWYRRWIEGDEFDYRQLLDFALDRRAGRTPSERLYIKRLKALRDVAVLLLVDLSRSTANAVGSSDVSVLDVEKEAIVLFSEALQVVGDRYAIAGFSGVGRLGVEYLRIKDFGDPLDDRVRGRINAMAPRRNTRMGAAIRHAGNRLSEVPCRTKLLILLGDGFPNDLNYKKGYAVEDTRRAIAEQRAQGIHVHAITVNINRADTLHLDELFGDIHHNLITEVTDLPDRLWRIYGALTG